MSSTFSSSDSLAPAPLGDNNPPIELPIPSARPGLSFIQPPTPPNTPPTPPQRPPPLPLPLPPTKFSRPGITEILESPPLNPEYALLPATPAPIPCIKAFSYSLSFRALAACPPCNNADPALRNGACGPKGIKAAASRSLPPCFLNQEPFL